VRILVVEDEHVLAEQVRSSLAAGGLAVDVAHDGVEGLHCASEYAYDAAIVDLGLPRLDGVTLIERLRARGKGVPVLVLTARDGWQDKVRGLNAGADDYLTKPFHMQELQARLLALVRRAAGHASPRIEVGRLLLDTARKEVSVDGAAIALTAFEYRVLEYLALHRDRVVSKGELTEHLYEQDFDRDSNTIEVFVGRLRRKLREAGGTDAIVTLRGQGYRLA
jgi:two-component system response regulator PhoP